MSTRVMKALRFAEFGPPSPTANHRGHDSRAGRGEAIVHVIAAATPQRHRERLGTLQEHNFAANPRPGFCQRCCKGKQHEGEEVWGSSPNPVPRTMDLTRNRRCPCRTLSLKPKSLSMAQAAAIGVPFVTAWASVVNAAQIQPGEHSHRQPTGGGASSHTDRN
jgi:hypothetical protein